MAHAWLVQGPMGIGKVDFAFGWAKSLLCESPAADGTACGACEACRWFDAGNHPDLRIVRPESLDPPSDADADDEGATKAEAKEKAASKVIKIDHVRAMVEWSGKSTHRQGFRVVVLYPAEAMQDPAANALLKTLEDPPPSTVFLLVADQPDRLAPTIVSRCRRMPLFAPAAAQAVAWLTEKGVSEPERRLAEAGGAPLAALRAAEREADSDLPSPKTLFPPGAIDAFALAEGAKDWSLAEFVGRMQRIAFDCTNVAMGQPPRYYPGLADQITKAVKGVPPLRLHRFASDLAEQQAVANHPLNARSFVESILLKYRAVFEGTA